MDTDILTTDQVAAELGMTPSGVRHLVRRGVLPKTYHGRDYRFTRADVEAAKRRPGLGRPRKQHA